MKKFIDSVEGYSDLEIMQAHQFLYYVKGKPVLTDFEYDQFCDKNGLDGSGGSDLESSYSRKVIQLAEHFVKSKNL